MTPLQAPATLNLQSQDLNSLPDQDLLIKMSEKDHKQSRKRNCGAVLCVVCVCVFGPQEDFGFVSSNKASSPFK